MAVIWANRLIAGTKTWAQVPANRKEEVKAELQARVDAGKITAEFMASIIGA